MAERKFKKDGAKVSTATPAVATSLLADGWEETTSPQAKAAVQRQVEEQGVSDASAPAESTKKA